MWGSASDVFSGFSFLFNLVKTQSLILVNYLCSRYCSLNFPLQTSDISSERNPFLSPVNHIVCAQPECKTIFLFFSAQTDVYLCCCERWTANTSWADANWLTQCNTRASYVFLSINLTAVRECSFSVSHWHFLHCILHCKCPLMFFFGCLNSKARFFFLLLRLHLLFRKFSVPCEKWVRPQRIFCHHCHNLCSTLYAAHFHLFDSQSTVLAFVCSISLFVSASSSFIQQTVCTYSFTQ